MSPTSSILPTKNTTPVQAARIKQILDAAIEEFKKEGFASANTHAIATRAGVAKGTLYLYFSSKEEMFKAVICREMEFHLAKIHEITDRLQGTTAEELLKEQIHVIYSDLATSEAAEVFRMVIAESKRFPELADFYRKELGFRYSLSIKETVELGIARGEFKPSTLPNFPRILPAPALILALDMLLSGKNMPIDVIEAYRDAHVDMILHGIKVNPK